MTMVAGSAEHRQHQSDEVDAVVTEAVCSLNDEAVFTADQIRVLQEAFWQIRHAIHKVI